MKILNKGVLLLALPLAIELGLLTAVMHMQNQAGEAQRWAAHSREVQAQTIQILEPAYEQGIMIRNALVNHDASVLNDSERWHYLKQEADLLTEMVSDNPEQFKAAQTIQETLASYENRANFIRTKLADGKFDEAQDFFQNNTATSNLDILKKKLHDFQAEEKKLADLRTAAMLDAIRVQRDLMIAAVLASIVLGSISVWIFSRSIVRRLSVLSENARALSSHENITLQPIGGRDEISALGLAIEQTAFRLKAAETNTLRYQNELEQRAVELDDVNQFLRQQTLDNEMFVYSVSHDLRSPLVNLQGFSKEISHAANDLGTAIAQLDIPEEKKQHIAMLLREDIGQSVNFIQKAVMRAATIIDAMLRLSRAGRVEYQVSQVNVAVIVQRIIDAADMLVRQNAVAMTVETLPGIEGDATAIEQIFGNLINNALTYLDHSRPARIRIGHLPEQSQYNGRAVVTYFVEDNGLGIPAESMPRMFKAFTHLHPGLNKTGEGVGLALVRRMVERHSGRIWVESVQGTGSTFYVVLPIQSPLREMEASQDDHQQDARNGAAEQTLSAGEALTAS